jgi:RND family efflux transporter MFP subunit
MSHCVFRRRILALSRGSRFVSAFVLLAACANAGCERTPAAKGGKTAKVVVTTPIWDEVMDYQDFTGRLEPVKNIEIRARVSGYVIKAIQARDSESGVQTVKHADGRIIKEGDIVQVGDPLFEIDPRPYQADFNKAKADLKVAIAERTLEEKNSERARTLFKSRPPGISQQEYDVALAAYDKAVALVGAMEAARDRAQLYLDYTKVTAPVTGKISRRFADPGNLIVADNTVLTTIVSEDPMYAYFDVDERTYLELLALTAPGKKSWFEGLTFPVMLRLANENDFEKNKVGKVDFVDNRVVATSGTVRMRGVFANSHGMYKAGLFVRIRLPIGRAYKAILIPDEAILSDQERKYVWIVNSKNIVEYRSVQLGQSIKELRVIKPPTPGQEGKEGLNDGDRVIIAGMQRVRNGVQVTVDEHAPPAPPKMPLVHLLNGHLPK